MIHVPELKIRISFTHEYSNDKKVIHPHSCMAKLLRDEKDAATGWPFILGIGYSFCHPYDQYNKERGRKIALARALEDAKFERKHRKLVWDAYLNRK